MSGERTCSNCGASMQATQDWCLQCGAGAPRGARTSPGWRSAALAIGATAMLALGAAAAAYAALKASPARRPATPLAQTPTTPTPSATTPPVTTTPGTTTPGGVPLPSSPGRPETLRAPSSVPQIPTSTPLPGGGRNARRGGRTPNGIGSHRKGGEAGIPSGKPGKNGQPGSEEEGAEKTAGETEHGNQPAPVLLDTNAAQTYNPDALPASRFGDPSLAIDGEATTAWGVQLEPAQAPAVDAGLTLDLNAAIRIAKLTLVTDTPGMTVQVYGTTARKLPETLDSEGWVRLSRAHLVKRRKATIELVETSRRFRGLLVWILKAPTSSSGQFSGSEVKIDEVQAYEAK